jgi:hypothetical protein
MAKAKISTADFVEMFERDGPHKLARLLNQNVRSTYKRRQSIERRIGRQLVSPIENPRATRFAAAHPSRIALDIVDGIVLVGSDGHYWPGPAPTAHRAFVKFCRELKPTTIIMNGDAFDGARISPQPPIGWQDRPPVVQELEAVRERLGEIETAAAPGARLLWPLGNHDGRFETRLATVALEYAQVHGFRLQDHVGRRWESCWSAWINNDVVVKHRFRGGIHAAHNNTMWAGKTMITGHLHALKVVPFPDYNGTRWGVETGCLADTDGAQFLDYTEDNPSPWNAGFVVLTFYKGRLLQPELVRVFDRGHVDFRGAIVAV